MKRPVLIVVAAITVCIVAYLCFHFYTKEQRRQIALEGSLQAQITVAQSIKIVGPWAEDVLNKDGSTSHYSGFVFEGRDGNYLAVEGIGIIPLPTNPKRIGLDPAADPRNWK